MKVLLLLCLFALISCNVVDVVTCLVSQPKLVEFVLKVVSYVATKDYGQILPALLASLSDLVAAVKSCLP